MTYLVCVLGLLAVATAAYADTGGAAGEAWYKVIVGVLGIPLALATLVVTVNSVRKTRLESRKLELEISLRQRELFGPGGVPPAVAQLLSPIGDAQRALALVLRFVLLQLAITLWKVVPTAIGYVTKPLPYVLYAAFGEQVFAKFEPTAPLTLVFFGVSTLVAAILDLAYWIIVFGFGWPLLKDTCAFLGIPLADILDVPILRRWKPGRQTAA
jgi:hypothetical protein